MAPVMKEEDENDDEEVDPPKINLKKEVRIENSLKRIPLKNSLKMRNVSTRRLITIFVRPLTKLFKQILHWLYSLVLRNRSFHII